MSTVGERHERRDKRRNLERVLQAAHELVAEHGANVTMEEVARRAGVGVGTIYRRFSSKEQLLATVSEAACQDACLRVARAADDVESPLEKLRAIVLAQHRQNSLQAGLLDLRLRAEGEAGNDLPLHQQAELYATLHLMLRTILIEGQRRGEVRAADPEILATLCLELLNPRVYQRLQSLMPGPPEMIAEHIVAFLVGGVADH